VAHDKSDCDEQQNGSIEKEQKSPFAQKQFIFRMVHRDIF